MLLANAAISHRSTVFTLMLIAVVMGVYSYVTLPRESTPDITVPYVLVNTMYEGVAPEDVETLITLPIERKLKGLKDVEEVRSVSAEGSSMITIEFTPDVDIDNRPAAGARQGRSGQGGSPRRSRRRSDDSGDQSLRIPHPHGRRLRRGRRDGAEAGRRTSWRTISRRSPACSTRR